MAEPSAPHHPATTVTGRTLAVLLVTLAVAPLSAQGSESSLPRPPKRGGGLWVDAGAGYGRLRLTCADCPNVTTANGTAVTVSAGFTPVHNALLGLQVQRWSGSAGQVSSLLAVVQWYPWPATGLFTRAGSGIVRGPGAIQGGDSSPSTQGTGVAFALGVGYDVKLNRRLGLTVQLATHVSALGDLTVSGQPTPDVIAYETRLGMAIVLR